jgi:hypothetical protein
MDDRHVDEIEQRSVRAGFSQGASLLQFLGDFDQTVDFLRHGIVSFSYILPHPPQSPGVRFPALRPLARPVRLSFDTSPMMACEFLSNRCRSRSQLYKIGNKPYGVSVSPDANQSWRGIGLERGGKPAQ